VCSKRLLDRREKPRRQSRAALGPAVRARKRRNRQAPRLVAALYPEAILERFVLTDSMRCPKRISLMPPSCSVLPRGDLQASSLLGVCLVLAKKRCYSITLWIDASTTHLAANYLTECC